MPRPPKINHPLRRLRQILGPHVSQRWMAGVLGLKPITLTKIENGDRLVLTKEQKFALASRFGIHPSSFANANSKLVDLFGEPFTPASKQRWEQLKPRAGKLTEIGLRAGVWLSALLIAARDAGRLMEVKMSFDEWLSATLDKMKLRTAFFETAEAVTRYERVNADSELTVLEETETPRVHRVVETYQAEVRDVTTYRPILGASHLVRDKSHARGPGAIFDGYEYSITETTRRKSDGRVQEHHARAVVWDGSEETPSHWSQMYTEEIPLAMTTAGLRDGWQEKVFLGLSIEPHFDKERVKPILAAPETPPARKRPRKTTSKAKPTPTAPAGARRPVRPRPASG